MSWPPFFPKFDALPATIPVFPLMGVLLLPRGQLPLNVFEPRYIAMTDDALAVADRLIGMVQPQDESCRTPPLYTIGCAGRITSFDETNDGRYLITLTGLCRFRIAEEVPTTRGYRRVRADWSDFAADMAEAKPADIDRGRLIPALADYFRATGMSANWETIDKTPDERLVTSLAMICPFEPREKQALLEAKDLATRAALILSILELAIHGPDGGNVPQH